MGQSLSRQYLHLVFTTKFRQPFIPPYHPIETELHQYISGIFRNKNSPLIAINTVPDHIHILFRLSPNEALANVVKDVKKDSSKWMKIKGITDFKWQIGYAAFSVSGTKVDIVKKYIKKQKEHHKIVTLRDEIEEFMKYYDIAEYDPDFFWD